MTPKYIKKKLDMLVKDKLPKNVIAIRLPHNKGKIDIFYKKEDGRFMSFDGEDVVKHKSAKDLIAYIMNESKNENSDD